MLYCENFAARIDRQLSICVAIDQIWQHLWFLRFNVRPIITLQNSSHHAVGRFIMGGDARNCTRFARHFEQAPFNRCRRFFGNRCFVMPDPARRFLRIGVGTVPFADRRSLSRHCIPSIVEWGSCEEMRWIHASRPVAQVADEQVGWNGFVVGDFEGNVMCQLGLPVDHELPISFRWIFLGLRTADIALEKPTTGFTTCGLWI
ncbi:MAG: hypothetical protein ABI318_21660 [Chthoniobacteraceae bacterium]